MGVDEWVDREQAIILSDRTSSISGPLRLSFTPYLRKPLQAFTNPDVERIGFCAGAQGGKTTFTFCVLGYIIDYDPGPTMILYPTQDTAKEVSKDRIQVMIAESPKLRRHLTQKLDDFQLLSYSLDRFTLRFSWAQSEASTRQRPTKNLIKDESSAFPPGASSSADQRTKSFWNRRIIEVSTPKSRDDSMWRFMGLKPIKDDLSSDELMQTYNWKPATATTVWFYHVPCPHCGKMIRLEYGQIRWDKKVAIREIESNAWYECQECKGTITDGDKQKMLDDGDWFTKNPGGRWWGFHLSSLYAPWDSCRFGVIAAEGLRARLTHDPEVEARFVNNFLALPFDYSQAGIELITQKSLDVTAQTGYRRNQIPADVKVLTLGADVQKAEVYWAVLGWGAGSALWVIDWGVEQDKISLQKYMLETRWIHPGGVQMAIPVGAIDARYDRKNVIDLCKQCRILKPIQGEGVIYQNNRGAGYLPYKAHYVELDYKGKALPGSLVGYRINTVYWKQWLYSRINNPKDKLFHLPADRDARFERHLQSEHEVPRRKRGSVAIEKVWEIRPGFEQNHWLDCVVYASAIASIAGVFDLQKDAAVITGIEEEKRKPKDTHSTENKMGFGKMEF